MIDSLKPKSEFTKNVLILMTGATIAQAIPVAISPILTRLYNPKDFGVFALFVAITSIFGSIANGRYELAIMLPRKDEDAINVFALGFIINVILSVFLLLIVIRFHDSILNLLNNKEISPWLYLVPVSVFLIGLFKLLTYFNNRKKFYKDLAKANVYKSIGMAIVQLSLGFLKAGTAGLISGQIFSQIISNTKLFLNIKKLGLFTHIKWLKIISLGNKFKDFAFFNTPSALADISTLQLPYIILPKLYTINLAGLYFFANRIVFLPTGLIARNIGQLFLQKISYQYQHKDKIMPILKSTFFRLFQISLIISFLFFIFSPYAFSLIFGSKWEKAGYIAQLLSLIFFIRFIVSPLSSVFVLKPFVRIGSYWQFLYLFTTLILFCLCFYLKVNFWGFLYLYIVHEYIIYIIYLVLIFFSIRKYESSIFKK